MVWSEGRLAYVTEAFGSQDGNGGHEGINGLAKRFDANAGLSKGKGQAAPMVVLDGRHDAQVDRARLLTGCNETSRHGMGSQEI